MKKYTKTMTDRAWFSRLLYDMEMKRVYSYIPEPTWGNINLKSHSSEMC